jgi:hypothetical protein
MNYINQLSYPKLYLGKTKYSFAKFGCLTSAVIMAYNYLYGKNKTPDQVVPQLKYDSNGYLQWDSIRDLGLKKVVDIRKQATPHEAIKKGYASPYQMVILEINNGAHFVLLWGRNWPVWGYRIIDPFGGVDTFVGKRNYKVTGVRIVEKT